MSVEILDAGLLSTVQDLGRFNVMKSGFSQNGVMDAYSAKIANRLVGNSLNCAVIEMTMTGVTAYFSDDYIICLSGADMGAKINEMPIKTNKAYKVKRGDLLKCGYAKNGVRGYFAVSGGIDVPKVMGSRSTDLKCGFGGFEGRKLMKGDVLETGCENFEIPPESLKKWQVKPSEYKSEIKVRAVAGPQDFMFSDDEIRDFFSTSWIVTNQSDRMGIRLDGDAVESENGVDIISDGIVFGSVQVPKNGKPIILMADHQTTGGYAKIATVISVDLPLLAQARPDTIVRFSKVSASKAQVLARKEKKFFDKLFFV